MELCRLPPVVMLHLTRFSYDPLSRVVRKPRARVERPEGVDRPLDLGQHLALKGRRAPMLYDIVGIVNHHGRDGDTGHYTADCLHNIDQTWCRFDDTKVQKLELPDVWLPEAAYVIFLVKRMEHELAEDNLSLRALRDISRTATPDIAALTDRSMVSNASHPLTPSSKETAAGTDIGSEDGSDISDADGLEEDAAVENGRTV